MPKVLHFRVDKIQAQISKKSYDYIISRRIVRTEPFYSVLDRVISEFRASDKAELLEQIRELKQTGRYLYNKKIELEKEIKQLKEHNTQANFVLVGDKPE